jgi:hypothetical protein
MQAYRSKLLIASVAISCFVGPAQSALHQARTAGMPQRFLALARAADFLTAKAAFEAAVKRRPTEPIMLRDRARVVLRSHPEG